MGRLRSYYLKTGQYSRIDDFLTECKINGTDWSRWTTRMGRLIFHRQRTMVRELPFCTSMMNRFKKTCNGYPKQYPNFTKSILVVWSEKMISFGVISVERSLMLMEMKWDLSWTRLDMTQPDQMSQFPWTRTQSFQVQGAHFSYSTKLLVLAIELYLRDAPRDFCHYVNFAYKKFFQFVESRKEMTARSYRFFVEHAYNILQSILSAWSLQSICTCKNEGKGSWCRWISLLNKLDGYVWIGTRGNIVHIPKDYAEDAEMQEGDAEEQEEQEDTLPTLEVSIRPQPQREEKEEDVGSQKGEETSHHSGHSEEAEIPEAEPLPRGRAPEERYGNFMIQQLAPQHRELLRTCAFNSQNVLRGDDRDPERELTHRDRVSSFAMVFMLEYMAQGTHSSFIDIFQNHHRLTLQMNSTMNYALTLKRSWRRTRISTKALLRKKMTLIFKKVIPTHSSKTTWWSRSRWSRVQGFCWMFESWKQTYFSGSRRRCTYWMYHPMAQHYVHELARIL